MLCDFSPASPFAVKRPSAKYRILLVEDWAPWRRCIRSMLRAHTELQVIAEASDGLEGIQKVQELQPDLILLDIGLPHLNGIDTAKRIQQVAPRAKVIFVTQNTDAEVVRAALNNGAKGYVLKVDTASELLPAIEAALRDQKFVSRRLQGPEL